MKLLFYDDYRLGVLKGSQVVDVTGAAPPGIGTPGPLMAQAVMEGVIEKFATLGPRFEEIAAKDIGVALSSVKLRPPLFRPSNLLCAFSNYRDREGDPVRGPLDFFHKGGNAVVGSGDVVELPDIPEASVFQPEPELGYVIGRRARGVSEAEALGCVFGYTNFVDISARDIPNRRTPFFHKALDTWAPLGPVITTADEIPSPQNLRVRLWLNGELRQDYNTATMAYSVAAQIAWLSTYVTLNPGDVISCGTHHRGLSAINDGDNVEVEVDGLERLRFAVKSHGPVKTHMWRPPGVRD